MWSEFTGVPVAYRELFLQLAIRMTYCNADDLDNAQIVAVGGPIGEGIRKTLNIKERAYKYGLQALVKSGAIKNIRRGWYQINPTGVEEIAKLESLKQESMNNVSELRNTALEAQSHILEGLQGQLPKVEGKISAVEANERTTIGRIILPFTILAMMFSLARAKRKWQRRWH